MNSTINLPRYSIIVPVYNVADYLTECIGSLLAQDTESPYEILLVDDGSTDSSGSICDAYADKDVRVRVIHKSNGGVSSARNTGIQMAKGTYIFFVDSDDILEPEFLSEFSPLLADGTDLALCGNVCFYPDGREETEHLPLKPKGESGQTYLQSLFSMDKLPRAYSLWLLASIIIYPIVSTASSDAQDIFPMWLYLAILTLHCACAHSCLQSERKSI